MNRRSFLSTLASALISVVLARELGAAIAPTLESPIKWVDARDFGLGCGADDTAALQAALDCSAQLGGIPIRVPNGTYYLTHSLVCRASVHFEGACKFDGSKLPSGAPGFFVDLPSFRMTSKPSADSND